MINELRERGFNILNERRTAGAGEDALFGELLCLAHCDHIGAERRLDNVVEAELLKTGYYLTELCVGELA